MSDAPQRVLLVDDDEEVLRSMQLALEQRGYQVLVARDGLQGLIRAERDAPDLVVLDVVMPKRSGLAVLNQLRKGRARTPRILLITADTDPRHRDFAESRGADAFLNKPFQIDTFLEAVVSLLNS
jgi:two-component system response regulator MprA